MIRKDMVEMKSKRKLILTLALAAVLAAGSAVTAFAAETSTPAESSSGVTEQQDSPKSENECSEKAGKRVHRKDSDSTDTTGEKTRKRHQKIKASTDEAATEDDTAEIKKPKRRSRHKKSDNSESGETGSGAKKGIKEHKSNKADTEASAE